MEMTWKDSVIWVLMEYGGSADNPTPLTPGKISELIQDANLRDNYGTYPPTYVSVNLNRFAEFFNRVSYGLYMLSTSCPRDVMERAKKLRIFREAYLESISGNDPTIEELREPEGIDLAQYALEDRSEQEASENEYSNVQVNDAQENNFISSFGYMWRRSEVDWDNKKMLGVLGARATPVDFWKQKGIYILYNDSKIIYAGQSMELGKRLLDHRKSIDLINHKWNRFSWFGILFPTSNTGQLTPSAERHTDKSLVNGLESVLIEVLETTGNDKAGDGIAGKLYLQYVEGHIVEP